MAFQYTRSLFRRWLAWSCFIALLWFVAQPSVHAQNAAAGTPRPPKAEPSAADAGAPLSPAERELAAAPPPPDPVDADDFRRTTAQIRDLVAGKLDPKTDPQTLFDIPLDASEEKIRVERQRLEMLLAVETPDTGSPRPESNSSEGEADTRAAAKATTASAATASATTASATILSTEAAPSAALPAEVAPNVAVWSARVDLDRERLAFYSLPAAQRAELLQKHAERTQEAVRLDHEKAMSQADQTVRRAEEQQKLALEAAQRAKTEAARLINEEHARLLSITQKQAEFERSLLQRQTELSQRNEVVLSWRRRVTELISSGASNAAGRARVDDAYVELRTTLRQARSLLSTTLSSIGEQSQLVPQAGDNPLVDLPPEADPSVALKERARVMSKTQELISMVEDFESTQATQLMNEVETLNRLRLDLLSSLSAQKQDSVLGFGPAGWNQAGAEIFQVVLTVRYHLHAAYDWLAAIRKGDQRGQSAWLAFVLVLKWAFPLGLFIAWRRRAESVIANARERLHEQNRAKGESNWHDIDVADRALAFLSRVRKPLEWLLLVGAITWLIPGGMQSLLEVRLASAVLLWIFGGLFLVLAVDALSSASSGGSSRLSFAPETSALRLRSLKLVGRAIVAFGLPLSLSELLVGQGTIYSWVFSTCWFAAIPILLVIIAWWRPFIFERFSRMRKPNRFEQWVLSRRPEPSNILASVVSSIAAVAGGIYLFALGAARLVRSRVLTFTLTRRLLAYLFRRDLSKKARGAAAVTYSGLPPDMYVALGPETTSTELVRSVADAQVEDVIRCVNAAGGGAIAIVGERGAGKTTLIKRIVAGCQDSVSLTCTPEGLPALREQLNALVGLPANADLTAAAALLDGRDGDHALLIDDAQYLVRAMMGGLADFDRLLPLIRLYSKRCTWILAFDEAIWRFTERARGARPLFDDVIQLRPWDEPGIVRLITHRSSGVALKPDFTDLALDLPPNADEFDIQEAMRSTEANYYRLLWDYAAGNPGVALHFWRRSLSVTPTGEVRVKLFDASDAGGLENLSDATAFVLRAVVQLGWATALDITNVTSLPAHEVEDALRYGNQLGYFDIEGDRYRIKWDWFRAVTRFLQRRHLLYSAS